MFITHTEIPDQVHTHFLLLLLNHFHFFFTNTKVYLPYLWRPDNLCTPWRTLTITIIMAEGQIEWEMLMTWTPMTQMMMTMTTTHDRQSMIA